ncbi:exported hypothetical protein [Sphingomonas sp. T1]|nr:exported hypothetical protein [Sphingomonas sp. T1]
MKTPLLALALLLPTATAEARRTAPTPAPLPPPFVILTKVRTQGCGALSCLALDPDFRQDDGIGGGVV